MPARQEIPTEMDPLTVAATAAADDGTGVQLTGMAGWAADT